MKRAISGVVASSLGVLGACGGSDPRPLADAHPAPDLGVDLPVEQISLAIMHNGAPVPGVHTYFLTRDSALVAMADTDTAGVARATMALDGGSVTVVDPFGPSGDPGSAVHELRTFAGVKIGDHLVLTRNDAPPVTVMVSVPAFGNADTFQVHTTCGSGSIIVGAQPTAVDPRGLIKLAGCHGSADMLVMPALSTDPTPLRALHHANVEVAEAGMVDLTKDAYDPLTPVTFSYLHLPPTAAMVTATHVLTTAHGMFALPLQGTAPIAGGSASIKLDEPMAGAAIGVVDTMLALGGRHHVVEWGPYSTSYVLDASDVLLRDFSNGPAYDAATRRVSWGEAAGGATPDLTIAEITVVRGFRPQGTAAAPQSWRWSVAAPYSPGELQFPTLPTDVASWAPEAGDGVDVTVLMNASVPGHYDAVRGHVHDGRGASGFVEGALGRAVVVELGPKTIVERSGPSL